MANNTKTDVSSLGALGTIDRADLFGDIERLPQQYGDVSDILMNAVGVLVARKANLESIEAGLDMTMRKSAEISQEKITEKKIKSKVEATEQWQAAKQAVDDAEANVERCKYALKVLDKKERALELIGRAQIKELGAVARNS